MHSPHRFAWRVLRATARGWQQHRVPRLGAALAFYTVLSMAPLVVVAVGVASLVFARQQIQSELIAQLQTLVGPSGADLARTLFHNAYSAYRPSSGVITSAVGVGALLFGASAVLAQLKSALNTIWGAGHKRGGGIAKVVLDRLLSFALVFALGFLLLASLLFNTAVTAFNRYFSHTVGVPAELLSAVNGGATFVVTALLIGVLYRYLPDKAVRWRDVWPGSVGAALLFTAGKWLLGRYLGHNAISSAYGAAGSLIVVLLWIYYSAQIFFLGAELARATADERRPSRSPTP
ncbi:MAG: YihY/virulence factor BrkB family protein [Deinococcales bacterium]